MPLEKGGLVGGRLQIAANLVPPRGEDLIAVLVPTRSKKAAKGIDHTAPMISACRVADMASPAGKEEFWISGAPIAGIAFVARGLIVAEITAKTAETGSSIRPASRVQYTRGANPLAPQVKQRFARIITRNIGCFRRHFATARTSGGVPIQRLIERGDDQIARACVLGLAHCPRGGDGLGNWARETVRVYAQREVFNARRCHIETPDGASGGGALAQFEAEIAVMVLDERVSAGRDVRTTERMNALL